MGFGNLGVCVGFPCLAWTCVLVVCDLVWFFLFVLSLGNLPFGCFGFVICVIFHFWLDLLC